MASKNNIVSNVGRTKIARVWTDRHNGYNITILYRAAFSSCTPAAACYVTFYDDVLRHVVRFTTSPLPPPRQTPDGWAARAPARESSRSRRRRRRRRWPTAWRARESGGGGVRTVVAKAAIGIEKKKHRTSHCLRVFLDTLDWFRFSS